MRLFPWVSHVCDSKNHFRQFIAVSAAKTLYLASDHAGVALKSVLAEDARRLGWDVKDLGPGDTQSVDYPDYAKKLCDAMKADEAALGVLICGSGIGMSMAANRFAHIRAALCHNGLSAQLARKHNDANVLCLGARLIGVDVARDCQHQFLTTEFEGGRHAGRLAKFC
ncbi:MAG: ribose 5-phosphate isomerase B [Rickettsiales bacterium]|nr:ribose 5-phosphate isomerase B [Rickettsiales bacterium]